MANGMKIARIFSVIGPEMPLNSQFAAGIFVRKALAGKIEYYGGKSTRTYLHVSDCADWLLTVLEKGTSLYPYDIAGDKQITIGELAQTIGAKFGVPVEKVSGPDRVDTYYPSLDAAYSLGCRQTMTLEQSIEDIHEKFAHLCHPDK